MEVICRWWLSSIALICFLSFTGCATHKSVSESDDSEIETANIVKNIDPWEKYNRGVFTFNDKLDGWILKPIAKGYRFIAPTFVEKGVNNFFSNLSEVTGALNNLLQWKWKKVGNNSGRFLVNSTIGIAGLFDVAKHVGLERKEHESFGQTLSYWGVKSGPYFVLPLLGPSTVTDAVSMPVDWSVSPLAHADLSAEAYYSLQGLNLVSSRANLLDLEDLLSGDKYIFIREAYMQRRNYLVKDGKVEDDFGSDEGFEEELDGFEDDLDEAEGELDGSEDEDEL